MHWLKSRLYLFFCGLLMGTADTIPGVSGGTVALITGIYDRLIRAIRSADISILFLLLKGRFSEIWQRLDLGFLLLVFAGIITAISAIVKLLDLPALLANYPGYVYALFFGLIMASVPLIVRRADAPRDRLSWLICFAIGVAIAFLIVSQKPAQAPDSTLWIFGAGALAICAMLLPGVSGSFLLLMSGHYSLILQAVRDHDIAILIPFLLGCICGLLSFSRLIHWLLTHYHNATLYLMAGLLTGSLWAIWPWQAREYAIISGKNKLISSEPYLPQITMTTEQMAILGLILCGIAAVMLVERMAKKMPG